MHVLHVGAVSLPFPLHVHHVCCWPDADALVMTACCRYHGGWLAPNIYYLGHAGSVMVNGIRISGASGIYKSHDFHKGQLQLFHPLNGFSKSYERGETDGYVMRCWSS